jgi:hypothetical protein
MGAGRIAWRRLAAALAAAALLLASAPLHQHLGGACEAGPVVSADAPLPPGAAHASADCPACHTHGRLRAAIAPAVLVALAPAPVAFRFSAGGAPADPSAASRPPTPPRGPPSPTA